MAGITLTARLPSSITVNLHTVPVSVKISDGIQQPFSTLLSVKWNVDPREIPAFRVVATVRNGNAAMKDVSTTTAIPAADLESRWGDKEFVSFDLAATLTLFEMTVEPEHRQGEKQGLLELKVADRAISSLPDGSYQGVLDIEVRNY